MDPATRLLIEALHRAPVKCVLAVTGGGTGAAATLLRVPGASRTVLELVVPYDDRALTEFIGRRPDSFCSTATARVMAERAYSRARWLGPGERVVGAGCTASLATDRPKRGDHRFHVAVHALDSTAYSLTMHKGARDRSGEEEIVDQIILNALAESFGIQERLAPLLFAGETLEIDKTDHAGTARAFFRGDLSAVCVQLDGQVTKERSRPAVLVPGAFNPLHDAHCLLKEVAEHLGPAGFELSITNVDKAPLSHEEVRRRVEQFTWKAPVWLTRAPTFFEKATIFPGVVFAVGADTAARIVDPRYYGNSEAAMMEALAGIRDRGCRFLVAGRDSAGRFLELKDLSIPPGLNDVFEAIPEQRFRLDLSSTRLRSGRPDSDEPGE
jgi:hypothetical protein